MFQNLKRDSSIQDNSDDIPAPASGILGSAVYPAVIDVAYTTKSSKDTTGIVFHFKLENGRDFKTTLWVMSATGEYKWEKDGRSGYWPGFLLFDEISTIVTGKSCDLLNPPEDKIINIWNYQERKEKPTEAKVLTELQGGKINLAILAQKRDHWEDSSKWVEQNELDKVFTPEGLSVNEKQSGATEGTIQTRWEDRFQFDVADRRKQSKNGEKFVRQVQTPAGQGAEPSKSLFE